MKDQFDPETLHGISFYDAATHSWMRYIYPDAGHWCAGWIVRKTRGGQWETYRKATQEDIASLSDAVVMAMDGTTGWLPLMKIKKKPNEHNYMNNLDNFIIWLIECSNKEEEDIHTLQLTTQECKELLEAIRPTDR